MLAVAGPAPGCALPHQPGALVVPSIVSRGLWLCPPSPTKVTVYRLARPRDADGVRRRPTTRRAVRCRWGVRRRPTTRRVVRCRWGPATASQDRSAGRAGVARKATRSCRVWPLNAPNSQNSHDHVCFLWSMLAVAGPAPRLCLPRQPGAPLVVSCLADQGQRVPARRAVRCRWGPAAASQDRSAGRAGVAESHAIMPSLAVKRPQLAKFA
jgi:hypothetical protein